MAAPSIRYTGNRAAWVNAVGDAIGSGWVPTPEEWAQVSAGVPAELVQQAVQAASGAFRSMDDFFKFADAVSGASPAAAPAVTAPAVTSPTAAPAAAAPTDQQLAERAGIATTSAAPTPVKQGPNLDALFRFADYYDKTNTPGVKAGDLASMRSLFEDQITQGHLPTNADVEAAAGTLSTDAERVALRQAVSDKIKAQQAAFEARSPSAPAAAAAAPRPNVDTSALEYGKFAASGVKQGRDWLRAMDAAIRTGWVPSEAEWGRITVGLPAADKARFEAELPAKVQAARSQKAASEPGTHGPAGTAQGTMQPPSASPTDGVQYRRVDATTPVTPTGPRTWAERFGTTSPAQEVGVPAVEPPPSYGPQPLDRRPATSGPGAYRDTGSPSLVTPIDPQAGMRIGQAPNGVTPGSTGAMAPPGNGLQVSVATYDRDPNAPQDQMRRAQADNGQGAVGAAGYGAMAAPGPGLSGSDQYRVAQTPNGVTPGSTGAMAAPGPGLSGSDQYRVAQTPNGVTPGDTGAMAAPGPGLSGSDQYRVAQTPNGVTPGDTGAMAAPGPGLSGSDQYRVAQTPNGVTPGDTGAMAAPGPGLSGSDQYRVAQTPNGVTPGDYGAMAPPSAASTTPTSESPQEAMARLQAGNGVGAGGYGAMSPPSAASTGAGSGSAGSTSPANMPPTGSTVSQPGTTPANAIPSPWELAQAPPRVTGAPPANLPPAGAASTPTRPNWDTAKGADGAQLLGNDLYMWAIDNGYTPVEAQSLRDSHPIVPVSAPPAAPDLTVGPLNTPGVSTPEAPATPAAPAAAAPAASTTEPTPYQFIPETNAAIEAFYRQKYEEAGQKQLERANAVLRSVGMYDSGTRGMATLENVRQTQEEISKNVTIPLLEKEQERALAREKEILQYKLDRAKLTGDLDGVKTLEGRLNDLTAAGKAIENRTKVAELTGFLPITAADLGVDLSSGATEAKTQALARNFEAQYGRQPTAAEMNSLINGEGVVVAGGTSTIAGKQTEIAASNSRWDQALARANATGEFIDPETGLSKQTLESWKLQITEAGVTGIYKGAETFQARMAVWDQTSKDKAVFGYDETRTVNGVETKVHVYGTNELQLAVQKNDQSFQKMLSAGFTYVDPDTGETRRVMGTDEREQTAFERREMERSGYDKPALGADGQPLKDAAGNLIMQHVEGTQEASSRISDMELALREKGLDAETAHNQALLSWEKQKTEGYYKIQGITREDVGLTTDDFLSLKVDGVDLQQFVRPDGKGVDFDAFFKWADNPANEISVVKVSAALASGNNKVISRMAAVLGRQPTQAEIHDLMVGNVVAALDETGKPKVNYITGTVGLEKERNQLQLTLQSNGIAADVAAKTADQAYQDKVRSGYWTTGANGQNVWIYGSQNQEERLLTLQNKLGMTRDQATQKWQEDQRVGYDQVQEYRLPNGQMATRTIHITGTQESQENSIYGFYRTVEKPDGTTETVWQPGSQEQETSLQRMRDSLVRDGWTAQEAAAQAQYIRSQSVADMNYLGQQYKSQRKWYYMNSEGLTDAQATTRAEADWNGVAATFRTGEDGAPTPLQVALEELRLDADQARYDADTERQNLATAITALSGIGGDVFSLLFRGGGSGAGTLAAGAMMLTQDQVTTFVRGLARRDGTLTKAFFTDNGFTDAQATQAMSAITAAGSGTSTERMEWARQVASTGTLPNGNPATPEDITAAGQVLSTLVPAAKAAALENTFGSSFKTAFLSKLPGVGAAGAKGGLTAAAGAALGSVTGTALVAAAAYGAYKLGSSIYNSWKRHNKDENAAEEALKEWRLNALNADESRRVDQLMVMHKSATKDRVAAAMAWLTDPANANVVNSWKTGEDASKWVEANGEKRWIGTAERVEVNGTTVEPRPVDMYVAWEASQPYYYTNDDGTHATTQSAIANGVRNLGDRKLFGPDGTRRELSTLTVAEEEMIKQTWSRLPGIARKAGAEAESKDSNAFIINREGFTPAVADMYNDIAMYAADMDLAVDEGQLKTRVQGALDSARSLGVNMTASVRDDLFRLYQQVETQELGDSRVDPASADGIAKIQANLQLWLRHAA